MRINEVQEDMEHQALDISRKGVGVHNASTVTLDDGKPYYVSYGYYVPAYDLAKGKQSYTERNMMVAEFCDRLDACAFADRKQHHSWEEIKTLEATYDAKVAQKASGDDIRYYGAELVLGMVDLMRRTEEALVNHHEQQDIQEKKGVPPKQRTSFIFETSNLGEIVKGYNFKSQTQQKQVRDVLWSQFKSMRNRLFNDMELVGQLRRQGPIRHRDDAIREFGDQLFEGSDKVNLSRQFDRTGVFSDMIRELAKAGQLPRADEQQQVDISLIEQNSETIERGKAEKIGRTLACIDAIQARLSQACTMHPALDEMPVNALLTRLSDAARGSVSLQGRNRASEAEILSLGSELAGYRRQLSHIGRGKDNDAKAGIRQLVDTLEFGYDLIEDMTNTKLACSDIFWPTDIVPSGMAKRQDVKRPAIRESRTYETDLVEVDARSDMALFELYSDNTIDMLAKLSPERLPWAKRVASTPPEEGRSR